MRLSCALLALFLTAGSLGACSNSGRAGGKPLVLTTFTVVKDMAQAIAGDRLQVESITSPDEASAASLSASASGSVVARGFSKST